MDSIKFLNERDTYELQLRFAWEEREKGRICPPWGIWLGKKMAASVSTSQKGNKYLSLTIHSDIDFIGTNGKREFMWPKAYFFGTVMTFTAFDINGLKRFCQMHGITVNDDWDLFDYAYALNQVPEKDIWVVTKQELYLPLDTDGYCKLGKGNKPVILRRSKLIDFDEVGSIRLMRYITDKPLIDELTNKDYLLIKESRKHKNYTPYKHKNEEEE